MGETIDEIDPPQGLNPDEFIAFRIRSDTIFPWRDGDIVLGARTHGPPSDYIGKRCVVTLTDGRRLMRELFRSAHRGRYLLLSHAAPPIDEAEVIDAAPVLWTKHQS